MSPCGSKGLAKRGPVCGRAAAAEIVSGKGMWKLTEVTENVLRSLAQGSAGILVITGPAVICNTMHLQFSQVVCSKASLPFALLGV